MGLIDLLWNRLHWTFIPKRLLPVSGLEPIRRELLDVGLSQYLVQLDISIRGFVYRPSENEQPHRME